MKKNKGNARIGVGDVVSTPSTAFDRTTPGSHSAANLEPCFGTVLDIENSGVHSIFLKPLAFLEVARLC
jgi:hypothetical protein